MRALLDSLWQDFRYTLRLLRLNPGFFAVAAISLALGIGANTAIFQLIDSVRLRLLPVTHPEQLVDLKIAKNDHCCSGNFSDRNPNFTYAQWEQIRDRQQAFSGIFAWADHRFDLAQGGERRYAEGLWVTGRMFETLAIRPVLGRLIGNADDQPGCGAPGAVLGYSFWQREFGGDGRVVGQTISLDQRRVPILGVAPSNFFGVEVGRTFDVAVPACAEPLFAGTENSHMAKRHHWWLAVMGRLKPGWTENRAISQLKTISAGVFENTVPPNYRPDQAKYYAGYKLTAAPAGSGVSSLRESYEEPLLLLLGIAGLVLLIACANLANLLLARASTREREMAIRLAMGAGRGRLIRQLLEESLLLSVAGAALGAVLAVFLSRYLVFFLSTGRNPLFLELGPNRRVLAFTAAVAIVTCLLFGLAPALRATRADPASAMKAAARGLTANRERFGLCRALVASQVALSLVLVVGALLFVRSLRNLLTLDAGFHEDGLLVAQVDISRLNFPFARRGVFLRELLDRVRATPGVDNAATAAIVPVSGSGWNQIVEVLGAKNQNRPVPWFNRVSPGYFQTLHTPLVAGRDFDEHDTSSSAPIAIVNQSFAAKYLVAPNPLGRQFRMLVGPGEPEKIFQIVGVVKNAKYRNLRDDFVPTAFLAAGQEQEPGVYANMIVRSRASIGPLLAGLRKTILSQNTGISIEFKVFKTQVGESLLRERLMAALSGFFGFLAAILASVGLYGVISYMVARRRTEIGIRMALGASRGTVMRLVGREAALLVGTGLIAGTALSIAVARTANAFLYGLRPTDPASIALAAVLLTSVAAAASFLPALRASRVDPMAALREE